MKNKFEGRGWIKQGLIFGSIMYVLNVLILPYLYHEQINSRKLLLGIGVWLIAGLVYGYVTKLILRRKENKK